MKTTHFLYRCLLFLCFALGACSTPALPSPTANVEDTNPTQAVADVVPTLTPANISGYPAPSSPATLLDLYPAPGDSPSTENNPPPVSSLPTLTPRATVDVGSADPDLGIVQGTLLLDNKPVSQALLYLAPIIYSNTGDPIARFNRRDPTRTYTGSDGKFSFINIPIGEYGLVLDIVADSYLLLTPDGDTLIIDLEQDGSRIDLGLLNYDKLPLIVP